MISSLDEVRGKSVTFLGLGLLGRGIAVARYLAEKGAILHITDKKSEQELASSIEQLKDFPTITYRFGGHEYEDIDRADVVIKAASVPLDSPYVEYAYSKGIPVEMDASLFCRLKPEGVTVIGITGTRGKSTVTYVLCDLLKRAGVSVHMGGNVKGGATLPLLDVVKAGDYVVLELDSWQLQGFGDVQISPEIAVFTSFYTDHMNYYKNDMQIYFNDKANIFAYQGADDYLVVGEQSYEQIIKYWKYPIQSNVKKVLPSSYQSLLLNMPGEHTKMNVGLAIEVAELCGVPREKAIEYAEAFPGIPYRLEYVTTLDGVDYYNDSNATSPEAVRAALESFPNRPISLITGGTDKSLIISDLADAINSAHPAVTLLPGTATDLLKPLLIDSYHEAQSMIEAIQYARQDAQPGGAVLLSPGAASFGLFINEYDRGDQFRAGVLACRPEAGEYE